MSHGHAQVFQRDAKQQGPTTENPYYSPDTMMPAALELRAAGVQFLRAAVRRPRLTPGCWPPPLRASMWRRSCNVLAEKPRCP